MKKVLFAYSCLFLSLLFPAIGSSKDIINVNGISYSIESGYIKIVIDMSELTEVSTGKLSNPERVFFDLKNARLTKGLQRNISVSDKLLKMVRVGQHNGNTVRVALDLYSSDYDFKVFTLKNPARLTINLFAKESAESKTETIKETDKASNLSSEKSGKNIAQNVQYQPLISGMELYRAGKYKDALEAFQKASVIFPNDPDIPFYIGLTYLQLNETDRAIEYFKKTLEKDSAYTDANFQLGMVLIQKKEYKDAISHLEQVYKKEPERKDLSYFLGFAYYQTKQYQKVIDYLKSAKTEDKTIASLILYYTGLARQQLGQSTEATKSYKQLIISDPTSPLTEPSQRLIEVIDYEKRIKKRFGIDFTAKVQYDDNVILVPTTNVFNLRDRDKKSIIELFYLRGEYALIRKPDYDLTASYGFYQTITNKMRNMDVQDHILSLDLSKRGNAGSMPYDFRINYSYDYLLLDYFYFLQRHTIRPVFILMESRMNLSVFQHTIQVKEFKEKPDFSEDNRDAVNHETGFIHFLRFNDAKHYIKAGYFYDREYTEGANWDYSGNKFITGFQYTFPKDIKLNVDYEHKRYRYKNINIFFDEKRRDTEKAVNTVLSKDLGKGWTISMEYLRRRNKSNIDLYDYRKNLYSVGASWRW